MLVKLFQYITVLLGHKPLFGASLSLDYNKQLAMVLEKFNI